MQRPALFRLDNNREHDPAIPTYFTQHRDDLDTLAQHWWQVIRSSGDEVRELLHDGHPTACLGDAAFASFAVHTAHVTLSFFNGSDLPDPAKLLQGTGKYMRHIKLVPSKPIDAAAVTQLITAAWLDIKHRVELG